LQSLHRYSSLLDMDNQIRRETSSILTTTLLPITITPHLTTHTIHIHPRIMIITATTAIHLHLRLPIHIHMALPHLQKHHHLPKPRALLHQLMDTLIAMALTTTMIHTVPIMTPMIIQTLMLPLELQLLSGLVSLSLSLYYQLYAALLQLLVLCSVSLASAAVVQGQRTFQSLTVLLLQL
jgi:hypothetical protein